MKFPSKKPVRLGIAQQLQFLKMTFPGSEGFLKNHKLFWQMHCHPTPLSRDYRIDLEYGEGTTPKVFVNDPCLADLAKGKEIPHLYQQKPARLCLYLPGNGEWTTDKPFSKTLIPWAAMWLFHFEDWLICGEWHGGGEHPKQPVAH